MSDVEADSIDDGSCEVYDVEGFEEEIEGDCGCGAIMCESLLGGERMGRVGEDVELCRRLCPIGRAPVASSTLDRADDEPGCLPIDSELVLGTLPNSCPSSWVSSSWRTVSRLCSSLLWAWSRKPIACILSPSSLSGENESRWLDVPSGSLPSSTETNEPNSSSELMEGNREWADVGAVEDEPVAVCAGGNSEGVDEEPGEEVRMSSSGLRVGMRGGGRAIVGGREGRSGEMTSRAEEDALGYLLTRVQT